MEKWFKNPKFKCWWSSWTMLRVILSKKESRAREMFVARGGVSFSWSWGDTVFMTIFTFFVVSLLVLLVGTMWQSESSGGEDELDKPLFSVGFRWVAATRDSWSALVGGEGGRFAVVDLGLAGGATEGWLRHQLEAEKNSFHRMSPKALLSWKLNGEQRVIFVGAVDEAARLGGLMAKGRGSPATVEPSDVADVAFAKDVRAALGEKQSAQKAVEFAQARAVAKKALRAKQALGEGAKGFATPRVLAVAPRSTRQWLAAPEYPPGSDRWMAKKFVSHISILPWVDAMVMAVASLCVLATWASAAVFFEWRKILREGELALADLGDFFAIQGAARKSRRAKSPARRI